jgi:hypothetical protein
MTAIHTIRSLMLWALVERLHRTMKVALMFHGDKSWSDNLPAVLLGLRCHDLKDLGATLTGLVSGVPDEFLSSVPHQKSSISSKWTLESTQYFQLLHRATRRKKCSCSKTWKLPAMFFSALSAQIHSVLHHSSLLTLSRTMFCPGRH